MNELPDNELDALLERHFADRLDPQLGRATQSFARLHARTRRTSRFLHLALTTLTAAAAVIALAFLPRHIQPLRPQQSNVTPTTALLPTATTTPNNAATVAPDAPGSLEQTVWSRTLDQGTVLLDGQTPARRLVRQQIETIRWTDPTGTHSIEATVPQEDVVLINLRTY